MNLNSRLGAHSQKKVGDPWPTAMQDHGKLTYLYISSCVLHGITLRNTTILHILSSVQYKIFSHLKLPSTYT